MRYTLLLLLTLAACTPSRPLPASEMAAPALPVLPPLRQGRSEAACGLQAVERFDFVANPDGAPIILVTVNGRRVPMLVDTGAETSVLSPEGAAWLNLAPGPARREVLGVGGVTGYGVARVDSLAFGDAALHGLDLPIMQLGNAGRPGEAPSLVGLVGADLLAPDQVDFDFPRQRMTLYRGAACRPAWAAGADVLDWRTAHDLAFVGAWLDGRSVSALLDTGASHSALSRSNAGLDEVALRQDPVVQSIGAGNHAMPGPVHRFTALEIGGIRVAHPAFRIVSFDAGTGIEMLIGMDMFSTRRLWLDFPGRRSFLSQ